MTTILYDMMWSILIALAVLCLASFAWSVACSVHKFVVREIAWRSRRRWHTPVHERVKRAVRK